MTMFNNGRWIRGEETNPLLSAPQADSIYSVEGYVGDTKMAQMRWIAKISTKDDPSEEEKANARLIVEAPELFQIVQDLLQRKNCLCEAGIGNPMVPNHTDLCNQASAVVARVKGEKR